MTSYPGRTRTPQRQRPAGPPASAVAWLKPGREKSLRHRHPWIFSGSIDRLEGSPEAGATLTIVDAAGAFLCRAAYSPASQIRARAWSFEERDAIDEDFFRRRIRAAVAAREGLRDVQRNACRVVNGESDGLPGFVADLYDTTLVVQVTAAGAECWRAVLADALAEATGATCIYERSDAEVRHLEGLPPRCGVISGEVPREVRLREAGLEFRVDVVTGQKTGFFLDQHDNRAIVGALSAGRRVLNVFCYTGGFTLAALRGGAEHVLSIDSSAGALALARENLARNPGLAAERTEWREADAFTELRRLRDAAASFDLIVLDPPKLAPTAHHAERAARAYKDINLSAFRLLRPGGLLATFSCSGGIDAALFRKIVAGAAVDAAADAIVLRSLAASPDHACALAFPEGEYLKGLLLRRSA